MQYYGECLSILIVENLAKGKPSVQSSTLSGLNTSTAVVDGHISSCSSTSWEPSHWWRVNLQSCQRVNIVRLKNWWASSKKDYVNVTVKVGDFKNDPASQNNQLCVVFDTSYILYYDISISIDDYI